MSEKELSTRVARYRTYKIDEGRTAYDFYAAVCKCDDTDKGLGSAYYDWEDKPHRLVFDLLKRIDELERGSQ